MEHDPLSHGSLNISDVIEVIQTTDPEFADGGSRMFPAMDESRQQQVPYVKIVEQPASKALRFRYECEGRSAGSIPGVSSTPENKTFPSIQIVGYRGRAVVVVSCVTKDPPYRPHPHNLVGKEGCKKGVCTVEITSENMVVSFSNLGIQCVKKKDIDEALKVREEIRVDPFRTGFAHRSQPTSIDLNAVRLCFQVFLEGAERGKFTNPLPPVVSDPIFDKKAMSDLVICKLSDCTCSVAGGKEIILLCEKVAKEDIQVRFYEEHNGQLVWEGFGDFQPTHVHKQVAISFRTPRYRSLEADRPVKAQIQLRRPSDGATSEPLPFEFVPLESGRPTFWSLRRALHKKGDYSVFSGILAANTALLTSGGGVGGGTVVVEEDEEQPQAKATVLVEKEAAQQDKPAVIDYSELSQWKADGVDPKGAAATEVEEESPGDTTRSLNELLSQVAELDEIYSDTRARLLGGSEQEGTAEAEVPSPMEVEDMLLDDGQMYSSLQMAMKNPVVDLLDAASDRYEDVAAPPDPSLQPPVPPPHAASKRESAPAAPSDSDKLPPLPPKRLKKSPPAPPVKPDHLLPAAPPEQPLPVPPPPEAASPSKQAKHGLFQKLFSKKKSSRKDSLGGGRSTRESSVASTAYRPPAQEDEEAVFIPLTGELTEAEHYALYTDVAPHATASEFDEMSFYYSPVEGGKIATETVAPRPREMFT